MTNQRELEKLQREATAAVSAIENAIANLERIFRRNVGMPLAECGITITTDDKSGMEMLRLIALGSGRNYNIEEKLQMLETEDGSLHMGLPMPAGKGVIAAIISPEMMAMSEKNGRSH